jgi:hypothetical protein
VSDRDFLKAALGNFVTANILMTKGPGTPSTEDRCLWLYARGIKPNKNHNPQNTGKWLLFHTAEEIDRAWEKVWQHTTAKRLGTGSKVSTFASLRGKTEKTHVICVYTRDYEQIEDVKDVRRALVRIGYRLPIPYKSDEMTRRGESGSLYYY